MGDWQVYLQELCEHYGKDTPTGVGNTLVPFLFQPAGKPVYLDLLVVLGDPEDSRRIARNHVRKSHLYGPTFLGRGVLSQRDNDLWKEQRKHLSDAFLPHTILKKIFPISLSRAKFAVSEIMPGLIADSEVDEGVEMNEFLLYEAMAQLQLALLGDTEENMNKCNKGLRESFNMVLMPSRRNKTGNILEQPFKEIVATRRKGRGFITNTHWICLKKEKLKEAKKEKLDH